MLHQQEYQLGKNTAHRSFVPGTKDLPRYDHYLSKNCATDELLAATETIHQRSFTIIACQNKTTILLFLSECQGLISRKILTINRTSAFVLWF